MGDRDDAFAYLIPPLVRSVSIGSTVTSGTGLANPVACEYPSGARRISRTGRSSSNPGQLRVIAVEIKIDDILAALILSLVMMRRLEVRTLTHAQNPTVPPERFKRWRSLALRAYSLVGGACAAKIALSLGWYGLALRFGVGAPWFQLFGFFVFLGWALTLVWAWKIATDARHMRLELGIQVRRRPSATQS